MTMAKVTLSVPDDLYERIDALKDQLNLSEIFRVCVSQEIERIAGKPNAEITIKLKNYLQEKSPFETTRKEEIERFTRKWGQPDIITPNETKQPYVALMKIQPITIGNTTFVLKIINNLMFPRDYDFRPFVRTDFNLEEWSREITGKLSDVVDFFKSAGFSVGENTIGLAEAPAILEKIVTDDEIKAITNGINQGNYYVWGLFAYDKDDIILIAYLFQERGAKKKH